MSGYPILAGAHTLWFYPPNWVYGVFQTTHAFNAVWLVHLWIGAGGGYVLARQFGVTRVGASATALAMMLGASFVARIAAGHMGQLYARAWLPWLLVMLLRLAQNPSWGRMLPLGVVLGMLLLVGPGGYQVVMYAGMVALFWAAHSFVAMPINLRARFVLWGAAAIVVGISLSAVQTLPSFELLRQGNRQGTLSEDALNMAALPIPMAFGFFFPHTFDDPSITDYVWPEFATYVGAAIIVLAGYALWTLRKSSVIRWWGVLLVIFMILAFGLQTPLYRAVLAVFPPYNLVRNPARHTAVVHLGLAILAGFGLDRLLNTPLPMLTPRQRRWTVIGIGVSQLVVILAATYTLEAESSFSILPQRALRGSVWFFAALTGFLLALRMVRAMPGKITTALLFGVMLLDLLLYAFPLFYGHNDVGTLSFFAPDNFQENSRYAVLLYEDESEHAIRVLQAADYGVPMLNIYSSILPLRAVQYANMLTGRDVDTYLENYFEYTTIARPDLLDMAGVRWVLVEHDRPEPADETLVFVRDLGDVRLLENTDALPLVRLVPEWVVVDSADESAAWLEQSGINYAQQVVIEGNAPDKMECAARDNTPEDSVEQIDLAGGNIHINVQTQGARLLVVNQTYVTGWQGWVNGKSAKVYPANLRWLGIYLPCAGTHEVHLRYLPQSLQVGAAISLAALALLLAGGLVAWRQGRDSTQ